MLKEYFILQDQDGCLGVLVHIVLTAVAYVFSSSPQVGGEGTAPPGA